MGAVNIHSKPETNSFKYAFVEDVDGKLVKISFDNIKNLLNYISADDEGNIVSWMESMDSGIKVTMKDGKTFNLPISQAKEFESVIYDKESRYLHFYDADGNDVYTPVYIEGGGSGGGGYSGPSEVKVTNQNGTAMLIVASGRDVDLKFNFTSVEDDIPTGNGICQISVNGVTKTTFNISQGLTTVNIKEYLKSGSNTVRVKCSDIYGTSKTIVYTVSVVDMYMESTFDATVAYEGSITFKYTAYGAIEKIVHILIDGDEKAAIPVSTSGKQDTYIIPAMSHGVHRLEVYSTGEIDNVPMRSESLLYDVMCIEHGNTSPLIASTCTITNVKQGGLVSIPWIVYDPTKLSCDVTLDIYTVNNGVEALYSTQDLTVNRSQQSWNTRKYPVGEVYFRIKYGDISKVHKITVAASDIQTETEENDLELSLIPEGRSNNEENPANWTYGDYSTEFTGFNWRTNGWVDDANGDACLRLNDNARAVVQFKPFDNDIRTYGKTIELEFAIRDVNSRDDVVISCLSGGIGFEVKADTAYIKSEQSRVFCNYKDEEKVRITFTVEARSEYRQLSVYLNGVLSDVIQYPDSDNFQQHNPVNISIGSSKCGIDIYAIRSYSTALPAHVNVDNLIADTRDIVEKTEVYERNDIYDEYGNISFEKCKEKNSVMVIIGDLPQSKGDKKNVKVQYYDIDDPSIDYLDNAVVIDVQGTSSQYYVRKNWKLKFSEDRYIDKDHLPAKVICIKVDYAEATGTHNTQNANFVETLYSERTPAQTKEPKRRTTIYGKPILLFHQADASSDPVFYGKVNYNYDKGAEHVFGFTSDYDVECWEFKNNTSAACNFTGSIPTRWSNDFEARYPEESTNITRFRLMHEWVVSTKDNLDKFKAEFEDHFDLHYCLIYYVYTFFALMVDQRAKNMFLTYWGRTGKWQPWFYDNDTSFGINNEGQLVFDYMHEDTDQLDGANVYNGQNSVLWTNFRNAYPDEIQETYQNLRNNGLITYDKLVDQFITNGSDKWSESIYNEDSDFKYISMLRSDNDATNLPQVRGSGEEHFRYFVENRLNYCDSKWYASDYANDYISLRIYTPNTWGGVAPNPRITITPFSDMYAGVRYKANGALYQERATHGVPVSFSPQGETFESENNESFNDTETAVYGAHQLSSIGDLAPLYCGSVNVSNADKLIELKVGDATEGYTNGNLRELSVGTNKLLKKIDVQNCPNFTTVLDLSNCPAIEEVYAKGSSITGANFPESGMLRIAQLPATITNFTLKHQLYVEELTFQGYDSIKTLWIENCPGVNGIDILSKAKNVDRLRLTNVNLKYDTATQMLALANRSIGGIDENGTNIDVAWIDGTCHIKGLSGSEYLAIKEAFPYLTITYDYLASSLIFMSEDGTTELTRQSIQNGGNGTDPVTAGTISRPTKESTVQYTYTFAGWSKTPGGSADSTALKNVETDRIVYAAFSSSLRNYTVRFYNGNTLLETKTIHYGGTATYTGSTPTNNSTGNTADFEFYGWKPSPTNIQGNTDCYAQYHDLREITDSWATIAANVANGTATSKYGVGGSKVLGIGGVDLPFPIGSAIVYNNEIHVFGSGTGNYSKHYKWNGTEWTSESTLPYSFSGGCVVVYNNEIHIMGGNFGDQKHYKWNGSTWTSVSTLPYKLNNGDAVIYNNEIHIMGGYNSSVYKYHYKWNGTEWTSASTLPYDFRHTSAVVYNNEIHILGGMNAGYTHYKWNGTEWARASTIPYSYYGGSAVVYNNEIHLLGNQITDTKHYKWNGTEWTSASTLPYVFGKPAVVYNDEIYILRYQVGTGFHSYSSETETWSKVGATDSITIQIVAHNHDNLPEGVGKWESIGTIPYQFYQGAAVMLNNELHILGTGSSSYTRNHRKWTGTEWVSVSTLPHNFCQGCAIVLNNEIHILGDCNSSATYKAHYKWNGTEWVSVSTLPYDFYQGCVVLYNNEIHILGGYGNTTGHYKWTGAEWTSVSTLPYGSKYSSVCILNNEIHILGTNISGSTQKHYKLYGTEWVSVSTLPCDFYQGSAVVYNNEIHILGGNGSSSYRKYHYKWDGSKWVAETAIPYEYYNGCALVYNDKITLLGSVSSASGKYFCSLNTTNPKATLTFLAKTLLNEPRAMTSESSNRNGWSGAPLRTYLNGDFLATLPSDLQSALTEVAKLSDGGYYDQTIKTTNDKVWIPSYGEVGGIDDYYSLPGQGVAYPTITDNNSRIRGTADGTARDWLLRSSTPNTTSRFATVDDKGGFSSISASSSAYILIGFCL